MMVCNASAFRDTHSVGCLGYFSCCGMEGGVRGVEWFCGSSSVHVDARHY